MRFLTLTVALRRRIRPVIGGAALAVSVGAGLSMAQGMEDGAEDNAPVDRIVAAEAARDADLSGPEQIEAGEEIVAYGTQISRRAMQMLDEAEQSVDLIRVTCVDDKLDQINATLRSAEARLESLRDAVSAGDEGRRNHEYTVLAVMNQNLRVLDTEASRCIGEDVFDTGTTRVETLVEDGSPEEDITDIPDAPRLPIPYLPPPASSVI